MMIGAPFTLRDRDDADRALTADEAEQWLVNVICDPEKAKYWWEEIGRIDFWLLVLAVVANPIIRDEVWDAVGDNGEPVISDKLKFFMVAHPCENDGDAKDKVRRVVHDVVVARYRAGEEEA
jgi:hypothetical protein